MSYTAVSYRIDGRDAGGPGRVSACPEGDWRSLAGPDPLTPALALAQHVTEAHGWSGDRAVPRAAAIAEGAE